MEKRSRRRIRDLVALAAFQGLSENEIGCVRISMMARSNRAPFEGRIQKRKTNRLQIIISGLHRTAGRYKVPEVVILANSIAGRQQHHPNCHRLARQRAKSADQTSFGTPGTTEMPGALRSPPMASWEPRRP
jgi:hypothetical protein